jgi:hypothetical protein
MPGEITATARPCAFCVEDAVVVQLQPTRILLNSPLKKATSEDVASFSSARLLSDFTPRAPFPSGAIRTA